MASVEPFSIELDARMTFGRGESSRIGGLVRECGGSRAFVVTDPGLRKTGIPDGISASLSGSGLSVEIFDRVSPNPTTGDVEAGAVALRAFGAEGTVVVAVGGGSAMDAAKAMALRATNELSARELTKFTGDLRDGVPLVALPTTAGTAAETNGFGVITDTSARRKAYIGHESVKPRRVVLDPDLTLGLPPETTAATGIDALSHALESLMSRNPNPVAEALALQAARMVFASLPTAVESGTDIEARSAMIVASNLAGQAFATGTGLGLCHAIAHSLGARLGVPHGVAIARLLPSVMEFNLPTSSDRLALAAGALGVASGASADDKARAAIRAVESLVGGTLGNGVVESVALEKEAENIIEDALADPVIRNTPRPPNREQVREILEGTRPAL